MTPLQRERAELDEKIRDAQKLAELSVIFKSLSDNDRKRLINYGRSLMNIEPIHAVFGD